MKEAMEDQGAHGNPRPHQRHPNFPHGSSGGGGGGGGGGREDCWSEGATSTLIEAWGDRYLKLSRGNLRQKDWKEVADSVNGRQGGIKPRKTDVQCKNRIDTLKKKYKLEKSKPGSSRWPFYSRLDMLVGTNSTSSNPKKKHTSPPSLPSPLPPPPPPSFLKPPPVSFAIKHCKEKKNPNTSIYSAGSSSKSRLNSDDSSESSRGGLGDDRDEDMLLNGGPRKQPRIDKDSSSDAAGIRELARAILKFGDIYEKIESSKQDQMMKLERQRMELTKDLEFQRMQMFMEAQLEIEKMKRPKHASISGKL